MNFKQSMTSVGKAMMAAHGDMVRDKRRFASHTTFPHDEVEISNTGVIQLRSNNYASLVERWTSAAYLRLESLPALLGGKTGEQGAGCDRV